MLFKYYANIVQTSEIYEVYFDISQRVQKIFEFFKYSSNERDIRSLLRYFTASAENIEGLFKEVVPFLIKYMVLFFLFRIVF